MNAGVYRINGTWRILLLATWLDTLAMPGDSLAAEKAIQHSDVVFMGGEEGDPRDLRRDGRQLGRDGGEG
jgi:hypothetical protein